jgi:hypothetical protein
MKINSYSVKEGALMREVGFALQLALFFCASILRYQYFSARPENRRFVILASTMYNHTHRHRDGRLPPPEHVT